MKLPKRSMSKAEQAFSFSRRAMMLGLGQGAVGLVLAGRMGWLAVAENEHYKLLSESNRVNMTLIPPRRGWIVDRNGAPIANNRTDFRVDIIPDRLENKEAVLTRLQGILALTADDMARVRKDLRHAAGFRPVQVSENLDWDRFASVSVRLPELTGVAPSRGFARNYPLGPAVAHLVGYVGSASSEQYAEEKDPLLITPGFKLGKDGLEKALEDRLRGKPGAKRIEVTARGRLVRELATRPDVPGETVRLTIDAGLQEYAARRMGPNSGSAVVVDVYTGDMLAMVSMPAYDPNSFSEGIGRMEWKMLSQDDHIPLMNKTLQGLYPPGSTVKPMHGLALLRNGISADQTVYCGGVMRVGRGRFHCWKPGGHGHIDMHRAIPQSCDIYFYTMARELGYDRFAPTAHDMGLGARFDLPFLSQYYGTVPDSAWKMRKYGKEWTVADSINASIGQGYVLVNPMQLAVMAARIAGGRKVVPRILLDQPHRPAASMNFDPEHLKIIREAMWAVVNHGGTGGAARMNIGGIDMAGKTGTAQVRRITMADRRAGRTGNASFPFKMRDHALFAGFAPAANPRYAVSVVVEHGGHLIRNLDAPMLASDILSYLFDREKAIKKLTELEKTWGGDIGARMKAKEAAFAAAQKATAAPPPEDEAAAQRAAVEEAATTDRSAVANAASDGSERPE
ncbi:penicillin-binding protein 2 [Stakelama saccharophila]|uniref:Penicillin-binding protein 2 n=1 Tax=Stakelama saccharophila TaxID=3075605 RepID=A0ABZ0B603_9SPHN|nr:penicillin-binding protein 2 [Stakelama sp. W311]WNO52435.1 penicillin-binding protein 2 [Stakelama sp. W311]